MTRAVPRSNRSSKQFPLWYIQCGDLSGSIRAPTVEAAFLKLVKDYKGDLARVFRAGKVEGTGGYYSTQTVLSSAGLWRWADETSAKTTDGIT